MVLDTLDVFLSSDQEEFEEERKKLSKIISDIPFLECTPLEERGADTRGVVEASITAVRNCDIYIGIFGREYSEITIKEYKEAVKQRKQCLTYVKRVKERDERLTKFIEEDLKNRFKFHPFRGKKDLYERVEKDLRRLVFEILREGLEARTRSKREAQRLEKEERRLAPKRPVTKDPLEEAESTYESGNYLASIVAATVALELALREELEKRRIKVERKPIGFLLNVAMKSQLIDERDLGEIREIVYIRNAAIHEGKIPDRRTVRWVLEKIGDYLKKLRS